MERTVEQTRTTIENCLCFGMYSETHEQLGFARIFTDYVFFGYIMDLFIFDKYQGKELGDKLISFIINHEVVKRLHAIGLKTKDAHSLYENMGLKRLVIPHYGWPMTNKNYFKQLYADYSSNRYHRR